MSRISFDEKMEKDVNEIMLRLKSMGIKNVTKTDAVRFILEMNKTVQIKVKRTPRSKFRFVFQ